MNEPKVGRNVYSLRFGKIIKGLIVESYSQSYCSMRHGYHYMNGFRVKWDNGDTNTDHQKFQIGSDIFYSKEELISFVKAEHRKSSTIEIETCKDFYGFQLKVGDYVSSVTNNKITGIISKIYIDINDDYHQALVMLETDDGYIINDAADPRNLTTCQRASRLKRR